MLQPEGDDGSPGPEANTLATASDTESDVGFNAGPGERSRENTPSTNDEFSRLFLEEDPFADPFVDPEEEEVTPGVELQHGMKW